MNQEVDQIEFLYASEKSVDACECYTEYREVAWHWIIIRINDAVHWIFLKLLALEK